MSVCGYLVEFLPFCERESNIFAVCVQVSQTKLMIKVVILSICFISDCDRSPSRGAQSNTAGLPAPVLIPAWSPGSRHGAPGFAPAVPLTSTLDRHHGEKTQKEMNVALRAVWSMDPRVEPRPPAPVWALFSLLLLPSSSSAAVASFVSTRQDAPASCLGACSCGAGGGLPAVVGTRAGGGVRVRVRVQRQPEAAAAASVWLQLLPVNPEAGVLLQGGGRW